MLNKLYFKPSIRITFSIRKEVPLPTFLWFIIIPFVLSTNKTNSHFFLVRVTNFDLPLVTSFEHLLSNN